MKLVLKGLHQLPAVPYILAFSCSHIGEIKLHKLHSLKVVIAQLPEQCVKPCSKIHNLALTICQLQNKTKINKCKCIRETTVIEYFDEFVDQNRYSFNTGIVPSVNFRCLPLITSDEQWQVLIFPVALLYCTFLTNTGVIIGQPHSFISITLAIFKRHFERKCHLRRKKFNSFYNRKRETDGNSETIFLLVLSIRTVDFIPLDSFLKNS